MARKIAISALKINNTKTYLSVRHLYAIRAGRSIKFLIFEVDYDATLAPEIVVDRI